MNGTVLTVMMAGTMAMIPYVVNNFGGETYSNDEPRSMLQRAPAVQPWMSSGGNAATVPAPVTAPVVGYPNGQRPKGRIEKGKLVEQK